MRNASDWIAAKAGEPVGLTPDLPGWANAPQSRSGAAALAAGPTGPVSHAPASPSCDRWQEVRPGVGLAHRGRFGHRLDGTGGVYDCPVACGVG